MIMLPHHERAHDDTVRALRMVVMAVSTALMITLHFDDNMFYLSVKY